MLVLAELAGGTLAGMPGMPGVERVKQWVRDGGTLVTIGSATDFAREQLGLIALRSFYDTDDGKDALRVTTPGAFTRALLDTDAWLSAGYDSDLPALVNSNRVYLAPQASAQRRVVARYAPADRLHIAGHLWPESRARLPDAVFVYEERVGRGRVIAFAEDPNFRGDLRGTDRLFLNAVVVGPSGR